MDPLIMKDINSSLAVLLKDAVEALGLKFFVDGIDEEIESAFNQDSVLLRVNGPEVRQGSGETVYLIEVFVMLTDLGQKGKSGYDLYSNAGSLASELSKAIPVYRFGESDTLLGCLLPDRNSRDYLRLLNYGTIEKDVKVRQCAVIAKYELTL